MTTFQPSKDFARKCEQMTERTRLVRARANLFNSYPELSSVVEGMIAASTEVRAKLETVEKINIIKKVAA